jgi:hypothetical protein
LVLIGAAKTSPIERSIAKYEAAHPGVRHIGGNVTPPKLIVHDQPRFPAEVVLARRRPGGMMILEAIVNERGVLKEPVFVKGMQPDLQPYVLDALRKWRYEPARLRGKPVPVFLILAMNIHVQ